MLMLRHVVPDVGNFAPVKIALPTSRQRVVGFPVRQTRGPFRKPFHVGCLQLIDSFEGRSWTDLTKPSARCSFSVESHAAFDQIRGFGAQVSISGRRPQLNNYWREGVSMNDYANASKAGVSRLVYVRREGSNPMTRIILMKPDDLRFHSGILIWPTQEAADLGPQ